MGKFNCFYLPNLVVSYASYIERIYW